MRTFSKGRASVLAPEAVEELTQDVVRGLQAVVRPPSARARTEQPLDCLVQLKNDDPKTGIQYRDCLIDYTRCSNHLCIKKLV